MYTDNGSVTKTSAATKSGGKLGVDSSGNKSDNIKYMISENNDLIIIGYGDMYSFLNNNGDLPWYSTKTSLTSLNMVGSIKKIGRFLCKDCSGLKGELTIPRGVTEIEDYAFEDCSGFTGDLIIPEGVTRIGQRAFVNCKGINGKIIIPKSVSEIDSRGVFLGNTAVESVEVLSKDLTFSGDLSPFPMYSKVYYCYKDSSADTYIKKRIISYSPDSAIKYFDEENAITIENIDTSASTFDVVVDTSKFGGSGGKYLEQVNVLVNDTAQNVKNFEYTDDSKKSIKFAVSYDKPTDTESVYIKGEAVVKENEEATVFEYVVTQSYVINLGGVM